MIHLNLYSCLICVLLEPEGCTEGSVRLSDSDIEQEGIPEVCVNGVWGSICDSGWSSYDGKVFCKEVGYDDIGMKNIRFTKVSWNIFMYHKYLPFLHASSNTLLEFTLWRWGRSHCLELFIM